MARTHINKTLIALDDKINAISARIKEISEEILEGMQNDSHFFASDRHDELFMERDGLITTRDELHQAYMIIVRNLY